MVTTTNSLPRLGLGMAALGRPGYINLNRSTIFDSGGVADRSVEMMQTQANNVMSALFKEAKNYNMIPWIDCARSYGLSEKFVSDFLKNNNIKPEEVYISSKWGYTYVADWKVTLNDGEPHEVKDHSVENFLRQLDQTIELLGDYVNLYQVHSATFDSGILSDRRAHEALSQCKKTRGWSIGLSLSGPTQNDILREAMKIEAPDGSRLFDSVQCTYNLLEQRPGDALLEAHEAGMDIIIKEGMANGRLFQSEKIKEISSSTGYSIDQIALASILCQPFNGRVLSGAVTEEQLISNMKAIELTKTLKHEKALLEQIMESCCINSEKYWDDRSALAWN